MFLSMAWQARIMGEVACFLTVLSGGCGNGMCRSGVSHWRVGIDLRNEGGRRLVISEDSGRRGMCVAAELKSFLKVHVIGGTYVRSWSASAGES